MVQDTDEGPQRFPNLGSVGIAVLENLVERLLGASTVEEIKQPYAKKQLADVLAEALARVEAEFIGRSRHKSVARALLQVSIQELPSLKSAIWAFYERPNDLQLERLLAEQLKTKGSFSQAEIDETVDTVMAVKSAGLR